jgi:hypothetical protein
MGVNIFDPDDDSLPDFCRDIWGREPSVKHVVQGRPSFGDSLLFLAYGLFAGFVIGFSLGALAMQSAFLAGG